MKQIENEDVCVVLKGKRKRKGKSGSNTELEIGFAVLLDDDGKDTNKAIIRIEETATGIPPVVAVIEIDQSDQCFNGIFEVLSRIGEAAENKRRTSPNKDNRPIEFTRGFFNFLIL